jgi:hypothetical protein
VHKYQSLVVGELHLNLILEKVNLTLDNLVINLAPLFLKILITGILFDLIINCLQPSAQQLGLSACH